MITATDSTQALQQLADLQNQASEEEIRHRNKMNSLLAQIRDTANSACGDFQVDEQSSPPSPPPVSTRGPVAPVRRTPTASKKTAVKKTAKKKNAKKKVVSASERNYDNKMTLPQAIWDILGRNKWPDFVPDNATGLTAGEIKRLILAEKNWQSASPDPGNQISAQLGKFKNANKIIRGEERRYHIVKGAKFE